MLAVFHVKPQGLEAAEYRENFKGAKGELDGRKTAPGFGDWVAQPKFVVKDGSMALSSSEIETQSAWFSLPKLKGKSQLRVMIRCHSRGSGSGALPDDVKIRVVDPDDGGDGKLGGGNRWQNRDALRRRTQCAPDGVMKQVLNTGRGA